MLDFTTPSFKAFTKPFVNLSMILTKIGIKIYIPNEKDVLAPLTINALWDTGASSSAVCPKIVSDLGLQPLRKVDVTHADGVSRKNLYKVNISLPNKFLIKNIEVIEADLVGKDRKRVV